MKIARIGASEQEAKVALLQGDVLLDVVSVSVAAGLDGHFTHIDSIVGGGGAALDWLAAVADFAADRRDPSWEHNPATVRYLPPVSPRPVLAAGRNFRAHREESNRSAHGSPELHGEFPTGFVKLPHSITGHGAQVFVPPDTTQLDYEVEVALVLSKPLYRASRVQAADAVFGYTVFNDLSARDWQLKERKNNLLLVGKNFPGAGPLGPWIVTADEVRDASKLSLSLHVNGQERQNGSCADMLFSFDELLSFWSRVGLGQGDVVATGTPEGVALHRKPDPAPFFLKPGDVVSASVDQIGTLQVTLVKHPNMCA